jgi:hypothetical protein
MGEHGFRGSRLRLLVPVVGVIALVGLVACQPPKPPPPPPQLGVTDFTINVGPQGTPPNAFVRNPTPFAEQLGPNANQFAVQSQNGEGQFGLLISNAPGYADDGFYVELGRLADLNKVEAMVTGHDPVALNLWLDKSGNGEFFAWNADGVLTGLDGDAYGTAANGRTITVDDTTTVSDLSGIGGNFRLAQLKSGSATGINGDTKVAIWVGVCCGSGSQNALVQSLKVNDVTVK